MSEENNDAVTVKRSAETSLDEFGAILAEMHRDAGVQTNPSPLYRYADRLGRVKDAIEQERRQLRSLVGRFANCHEDNEDFGALLREARFVLTDTPYAVVDGEPVAVLHGRVAVKAGAESRPFVGVDLAKDKPTFVCATIAPGNAAAMRDALKRILAIEGYGAPWVEAKCIAQKALEGEQYTPPIAKETAKIEQPGSAAALREALTKARLYFDHRGEWSNIDDAARAIDAITSIYAALAAPPRNCDVGTADDLHAAFVRYCDACNPPGGCCHRKDTRGMLDTGCASVLKCFARFVLAKKEGGAS